MLGERGTGMELAISGGEVEIQQPPFLHQRLSLQPQTVELDQVGTGLGQWKPILHQASTKMKEI